MFVRSSTYLRAIRAKQRAEYQVFFLLQKVRSMQLEIDLIKYKENSDFSREELDKLIRLCHPDKHGNSKASTEITQKLLSLREQVS